MTETPTPEQAAGASAVSRRQALAVGGGLAAAAVSSVAGAAPALAADAGDPQTLRSVSAQQAKAIVVAAEREATRLRVPSFIVVVDVCGDVKGSLRQDGNSRASLTLAPLKAQTALAFRTPTATLAQRTTDPVRAQSLLAAGFTLLGGRLPITARGAVIGAIGVGGGSPRPGHPGRPGRAGRPPLESCPARLRAVSSGRDRRRHQHIGGCSRVVPPQPGASTA